MRRSLVIGLAIALGAGAAYLTLEPGDERAADALPERTGATDEPDYTMDRFTATAMDEAGAPKHRLEAEDMAHFEAEDRSELSAPVLTFHDDGVLTWTLQAERGTITDSGEWVHLADDVVITGHTPDGTVHTRIETDRAAARPDARYAETDEYVHMERADGTKEAVGARVDFDAGHVELISRVRGLYLAPGEAPAQ